MDKEGELVRARVAIARVMSAEPIGFHPPNGLKKSRRYCGPCVPSVTPQGTTTTTLFPESRMRRQPRSVFDNRIMASNSTA